MKNHKDAPAACHHKRHDFFVIAMVLGIMTAIHFTMANETLLRHLELTSTLSAFVLALTDSLKI